MKIGWVSLWPKNPQNSEGPDMQWSWIHTGSRIHAPGHEKQWKSANSMWSFVIFCEVTFQKIFRSGQRTWCWVPCNCWPIYPCLPSTLIVKHNGIIMGLLSIRTNHHIYNQIIWIPWSWLLNRTVSIRPGCAPPLALVFCPFAGSGASVGPAISDSDSLLPWERKIKKAHPPSPCSTRLSNSFSVPFRLGCEGCHGQT